MSLEQAWAVFEFPPGVEPGGLWRRGVALIIDLVLIWLPPVLVVLLLSDRISGEGTEPKIVGVFGALAWPVYEALMMWRRGATLGKLATGIRVVRMDDLGTPSLGQAASRASCRLLFFVSVMRFLHASARADSDDAARQRGLADRSAGTIVVRRP